MSIFQLSIMAGKNAVHWTALIWEIWQSKTSEIAYTNDSQNRNVMLKNRGWCVETEAEGINIWGII